MKLARIPVAETVVQDVYQHLASQKDYEKENSKLLQVFKQIFELTGIPAIFSAEQADGLYRNFSEWSKLNEIISTPPSNDNVARKQAI